MQDVSETIPAALRLLALHPDVELLFTDVVMPGGMSGRQLADAAVARAPDSSAAHKALGLVASAQGELEAGLAAHRRAVELDPQNLDYRDVWVTRQFSLAELEREEGQLDAAVRRLQAARQTVSDMRHAIGYALNWPERQPLPVAKLDFAALGKLTFRAPDEARYPALRLAREVMTMRGLAGAAFNAAKEIALDHFIAGGLGFLQMANVVEETLNRLSAESRLGNAAGSLEDVLAMDHLARVRATEVAGQMRAA